MRIRHGIAAHEVPKDIGGASGISVLAQDQSQLYPGVRVPGIEADSFLQLASESAKLVRLTRPVDPDRFLGPDSAQPGAWAAPPRGWPQERVLERETLELIRATIDVLPEAQREVIRLRDIEGWSAEEVAMALEISDGNQRVLLHRARSKVRAALETYLDPDLQEARA